MPEGKELPEVVCRVDTASQNRTMLTVIPRWCIGKQLAYLVVRDDLACWQRPVNCPKKVDEAILKHESDTNFESGVSEQGSRIQRLLETCKRVHPYPRAKRPKSKIADTREAGPSTRHPTALRLERPRCALSMFIGTSSKKEIAFSACGHVCRDEPVMNHGEAEGSVPRALEGRNL